MPPYGTPLGTKSSSMGIVPLVMKIAVICSLAAIGHSLSLDDLNSVTDNAFDKYVITAPPCTGYANSTLRSDARAMQMQCDSICFANTTTTMTTAGPTTSVSVTTATATTTATTTSTTTVTTIPATRRLGPARFLAESADPRRLSRHIVPTVLCSYKNNKHDHLAGYIWMCECRCITEDRGDDNRIVGLELSARTILCETDRRYKGNGATAATLVICGICLLCPFITCSIIFCTFIDVCKSVFYTTKTDRRSHTDDDDDESD